MLLVAPAAGSGAVERPDGSVDVRVRLRLDTAGGPAKVSAEATIDAYAETARGLGALLETAGANVATALPFDLLRRKAQAGAEVEAALAPLAGWLRVTAPPERGEAVLALLATNGSVESFEPALAAEVCAVPDDPFLANQATFLAQVDALAAWDLVKGEQGDVVIAVVDTGTEWRHPDLVANVWSNPGEIEGNGVDDDGNGFVDDVRGWNFPASSNDPTGLEDQNFNRLHGTHVAGIAAAATDNGIGVTGVSWNAKLLPINAAHPTLDRTVAYGYEGILYAAVLGADVINCSWRRRGQELAFERSVVQAALALGSLVVAASGNDGLEEERIFPAAYPEVMAVSSTNSNANERWALANVGRWVDVVAPGGGGIYSTSSNGGYALQIGTSMAAPVVAGAAALVKSKHPDWGPRAIWEQIRVTATDLDPLHPGLEGLLGGGRLNVAAAVRDSVPGLRPSQLVLVDQDGDGFPEGGEVLTFRLTVTNELAEAENVLVRLRTDDPYLVPLETAVRVNRLRRGDSLEFLRGLTAWLSYGAPLGHVASVRFAIEYPQRTLEYEVPVPVSPLHATVRGERIEMSVTSTGKIGFADTSSNDDIGGIGLRRTGGRSVLFTGGLMVGVAADRVSDAVHAWFPDDPYEDFRPIQGGGLQRPGAEPGRDAVLSVYNDLVSSRGLGIEVRQEAMAYADAERGGFVIVHLQLRSQVEDLVGVRAGALIDWDVGSRDGPSDLLRADAASRILWSGPETADPRYGVAGVAVLEGPAGFETGWLWQFGPLGRDDGVPYLFDLDALDEKLDDPVLWDLLRGVRPVDGEANGEIVGTLAVGPFDLARDETVDLALGFVVADDEPQMREEMQKARIVWESRREGLDGTLPVVDRLLPAAPNPFNPRTAIRFALPAAERVRLDLYDARGRHVVSLLDENRQAGFHRVVWDGRDAAGRGVSSGIYHVLLRTPSTRQSGKITLLR